LAGEWFKSHIVQIKPIPLPKKIIKDNIEFIGEKKSFNKRKTGLKKAICASNLQSCFPKFCKNTDKSLYKALLR